MYNVRFILNYLQIFVDNTEESDKSLTVMIYITKNTTATVKKLMITTTIMITITIARDYVIHSVLHVFL